MGEAANEGKMVMRGGRAASRGRNGVRWAVGRRDAQWDGVVGSGHMIGMGQGAGQRREKWVVTGRMEQDGRWMVGHSSEWGMGRWMGRGAEGGRWAWDEAARRGRDGGQWAGEQAVSRGRGSGQRDGAV